MLESTRSRKDRGKEIGRPSGPPIRRSHAALTKHAPNAATLRVLVEQVLGLQIPGGLRFHWIPYSLLYSSGPVSDAGAMLNRRAAIMMLPPAMPRDVRVSPKSSDAIMAEKMGWDV